ncbi:MULTISPECIES: hypothetical protein [unclassified Okeania]|nr:MULTISPECIES: hypothetical protein [unclassified Okeania]
MLKESGVRSQESGGKKEEVNEEYAPPLNPDMISYLKSATL